MIQNQVYKNHNYCQRGSGGTTIGETVYTGVYIGNILKILS
jgi:hypothetical protein